MLRHAPATLVLLVLSLLAACTPSSITLNFGDAARLKESAVERVGHADLKVALIDVRGLIIDGPTPGLFTSGRNPVAELAARLKRAEDDPTVRALVLRINSPGGGVGATETMYALVRRFRQRTGRPVVVSLADVAASGGYYLALAGDRIIASPTGVTGSIGVIMPTFNFAEGMKKVGIVSRSVKSAANKDLANPFEPIRDSQYAVLQSLVDGMYATFRARVVARRGASPDQDHPPAEALLVPLDLARLDELTDGRVLLGSAAVAAGLADKVGDLYDAFADARELAGLTSATLVTYYRGTEPPATPFAGAEWPVWPEGVTPAPAAATEVNLLQLNVSGAVGLDQLPTSAGVYYLWSPGA